MTDDRISVRLNVNDEQHELTLSPRRLLSDVIREDLGLMGTHVGCEHGVCGACTVLIDGVPARACLTFAVQMHDHEIKTVESLARGGEMHPLQRALHEEHGLQCGYCTAGILVTFEAFLRDVPDPTEDEVRDVLSGNLCRCTGYQNIVSAVLKAARELREEAMA